MILWFLKILFSLNNLIWSTSFSVPTSDEQKPEKPIAVLTQKSTWIAWSAIGERKIIWERKGGNWEQNV